MSVGLSQASQAEFSVTYDGQALTDGRMAVRDLAPALLALGDAFHEAQQVIYPLQQPVTLEIRAFEKGSFEVFLNLAELTVVGVMTSPEAAALANLITYLTAGKDSVFWLIKSLRGHKPERIESTQAGVTRLMMPDGTVLESPTNVVLLYERPGIRESARRFVSPLEKEGINRLEVSSQDNPPLVLRKQDIPAFDPDPVSAPDIPLVDEETTMALTVQSPDFVPGNKWRVYDGERSFYVGIEDQVFWEKVAAHQERFTMGDTLIARVRVRQWATESGLRVERAITSVERHIEVDPEARPTPVQLNLPTDELGV